MFAAVSHLDLGLVCYCGKSPKIGGIRSLPLNFIHVLTQLPPFSASIVPKLEPMANPFALPPVFSKRMLRASSTPEKLVNCQGCLQ